MVLQTQTGSAQTYSAVEAAGPGVVIPDADLLFTADYSRAGHDLILTGSDGAKFLVTGYFNTDAPSSLISPSGAKLPGDVVMSLAGPQFPGQYAQAGDAPSGKQAIGKVESSSGSASAVRSDGTTVTLKAGDPVFQGDVILTGPASKLGISFTDGTIFSISANARMVLNSLIYDPDSSNNSMLFSLVEGNFVFSAGQIAPNGDMKIQTPVATMGIRGTAPTVTINSETGEVNFSIIADPGDGHVGTYTLYNLDNGLPIGTVSSVGTKWQLTSANGQIIELDKSEADLLNDANAVGQINNIYSQWQNSTQQDGQTPQAGPDNNPPPSGGLNTNPANPDAPGADGNTGGTGGDGQGEGQNNQQNNNQQDGAPPPPTNTNTDPPPPPPPTETAGPNIINGDNNANVLNGTAGDDIINAFGNNDFIIANAGDDVVNAGAGDDTIIGGSGEGDDHYDGGEGNDTLIYTSTDNDIVINLVDGTVNGADIGFDTFVRLENFIAGGGDDTLIIGEDSAIEFDGGAGTDTIRFFGDLNIDAENAQIVAEYIEIIDLNKTDNNTLTISADGLQHEDGVTIMQVRGGTNADGTTDTINLTNDFPQAGAWQLVDGPPVEFDDLLFDLYEFIDADGTVLTSAHVEQGIEVNFLLESFENGFAANGWQSINATTSQDNDPTEGSFSAHLTTTVGNEIDPPDGGPDNMEYESDSDQAQVRGNAMQIANLVGVENINELDALASTPGNQGFATEGSAIATSFFAFAGQTLTFDWFFSTYEYLEPDDPYGDYAIDFAPQFEFANAVALEAGIGNDFASGGEIVNDFAFVVIDGEVFELFDAVAAGNQNHGLVTEGWNTFSIVLDNSGHHDIAFGVLDNDDIEVETNLDIDNIQLGPTSANVMTFNEGSGFPHSFSEAGMTVESHYGGEDGGGHIHLPNEALNNHSGCCSEPYHFEQENGEIFNFVGFDLVQVSVTGGIWTSSKGGEIDLTGVPTGNQDFSSNPLFQGVEWVEWSQPQGSSTIDNVTYIGGGPLIVSGTEQNDILVGGEFSEILLGLGGDDTLIGQGGDDELNGGSGNNTLTGGLGADKFIIADLGGTIDLITDFGDQDTLDLTGLLDIAFDPDIHKIDDFVQATTLPNGETVIKVDLDGPGLDESPVDVAVLQNVGEFTRIDITIGEVDTFVTSAAITA